MKQGTLFTKIIFAVLLVALLAYIILAAFSAMKTSITTVTALAYEAGEGLSTTGFVVRDETVLTSDAAIHVLTRSEGEKVAQGATVATAYRDSQTQDLQGEITDLEEQLSQLQYAYHSSSTKIDQQALENEILTDLTQCAVYTARGSLTAAASSGSQLKSRVLRRYLDEDNLTALSSRISDLTAQRDTLQQQLSGGASSITVDTAGYFSGTVDGYESLLSSQTLHTMTLEQFNTVTGQAVQAPQGAIGKLVTSSDWYYAAAVESDQIADLQKGDRVQASFAAGFQDELEMTVWRISDETDGKRLLILRCTDDISDATSLRVQSADIVAHSHKGLRVPKQAVYYSDDTGSAGVYVLSGTNAVWKNIEILYDIGESYIVTEDKRSIDNLWPGDEIILTSQTLFDGKVVS